MCNIDFSRLLMGKKGMLIYSLSICNLYIKINDKICHIVISVFKKKKHLFIIRAFTIHIICYSTAVRHLVYNSIKNKLEVKLHRALPSISDRKRRQTDVFINQQIKQTFSKPFLSVPLLFFYYNVFGWFSTKSLSPE